VAIAMYCNLRPPEVAPDFLVSNYEVYNALIYNMNNPATSTDP